MICGVRLCTMLLPLWMKGVKCAQGREGGRRGSPRPPGQDGQKRGGRRQSPGGRASRNGQCFSLRGKAQKDVVGVGMHAGRLELHRHHTGQRAAGVGTELLEMGRQEGDVVLGQNDSGIASRAGKRWWQGSARAAGERQHACRGLCQRRAATAERTGVQAQRMAHAGEGCCKTIKITSVLLNAGRGTREEALSCGSTSAPGSRNVPATCSRGQDRWGTALRPWVR